MIKRMKIDIDFSVFESPVKAFGNFTGCIELDAIPSVGGDVFLFVPSGVDPLVFDGKLKVLSVIHAGKKMDKVIVCLEDVICSSRAQAEDFVRELESKLDLFFVEYEL